MSFIPNYTLDPSPHENGTGRAPGWVIFLHGIYGSGVNWQSFARDFAAQNPWGWGALRVDLRMHGQSQQAPPPHNIDNAALDLLTVVDRLQAPVVGVSGHSFGGKVALEFARKHSLQRLWVLDSDPAARPDRLPMASEGDTAGSSDTVLQVLGLLEQLPAQFDSRPAFLSYMQQHGIAAAVAQWLAKNLVASTTGVRFGLDPRALRELLSDYFRRDLLSVVEEEVLADRIDFVFGGASQVVSKDTRARINALQDEQFRVHVLEGAGHWVHVDAPGELLRVMIGSA